MEICKSKECSGVWRVFKQQFRISGDNRYLSVSECCSVAELHGEDRFVLCGDGRFDSMGHSARYGSYTIYCENIKNIIHFDSNITPFHLS